jgi:hypothetical protein
MRQTPGRSSRKVAALEASAAMLILFIVIVVLAMIFIYRPS